PLKLLSAMRPIPSSRVLPIFHDRPALLILALSFVARAVAAASVGPGFDEAYYHLFARHLAPGYFDHPPIVAVTAGLGWWLTGAWHPLALRFGALVVFSLSQVGFYTLARDLYNRRAAIIALLLPLATPFFAVGAGAFVIPDNGLVAAWIWALWVLARLRSGQFVPNGGFIALGALLGLAMLAKYHAVLLPASFALATVFDPELRRWWRNPRLYLSLVVAALVFLPNLIWNANNGWIAFAGQFGKGISGGFRFRFDLFGQALGGQLSYLTPWVCAVLWIGALRPRREDRGDAWLIPFFLLPVVGMTLLGLTRGILPHWTMPGYIAALVLTSGWLSTKPWEQHFMRGSLIANGLLVILVIVQAQAGILRIRPKADPTLDLVGWRQTILYLERNGLLQQSDVLFAHKWFTAGEIAWADRGEHPVVLIGDQPHMFAWWTPEPEWEGASGVLITQARYTIDPRKMLEARFARVSAIDVPPVRRGKTLLQMRAWRVDGLNRPQFPPYGPWADRR
ncbi:MAG: glycosyltransferase family 39 protein, partial [bacterium]